MLKESNQLLKLNFENKKSAIIEFYDSFSESLFSLFDLILEEPLENFSIECFHLFFGYFQIISYIFDSTVRIN